MKTIETLLNESRAFGEEGFEPWLETLSEPEYMLYERAMFELAREATGRQEPGSPLMMEDNVLCVVGRHFCSHHIRFWTGVTFARYCKDPAYWNQMASIHRQAHASSGVPMPRTFMCMGRKLVFRVSLN